MASDNDFAQPLAAAAQQTATAVTITGSSSSSGSYSTVASASGITVVPYATHLLTGTTTVNTLTASSATAGSPVTVVASGQSAGICVVIAHLGGNIKLRDSLSFGLYAGESMTFVYDGTNWIEVSRDVKTVIDYQQITSNVSTTNSTEGTAATAITSSTITYDGATPIRVEFFTWDLAISGGSNARVALYDASSSIGILAYSNGDRTVLASRRFTPSAASRAYSARVYAVGGGTATVTSGAAGSGDIMPSFLRISRDV